MSLKFMKSIRFGIVAMIICCITFVALSIFSHPIQTVLKAAALSLLALSIIACMWSRFIPNRHRWSLHRTGDFFLHFGILLLLAAGCLGVTGNSTFIKLAINESVNLNEQGFPITITLKEAHTETYPDGIPRQFASTIEFSENGILVKSEEILVNHPARYKNIKVYQSTMENNAGQIISGLTVKSNPGLILLWPGFFLTGLGALAITMRR